MWLLLAYMPWFLSAVLLVVWTFWPKAKAEARRPDYPAFPDVEASASLLVIGPSAPIQIQSQAPQLVAPLVAVVTVGPAPAITVGAPPLEAWEEKGWKKCTEDKTIVYDGYYQVTDRRTGRKRNFHGKVKMEGRVAQAYIADPPMEFFANHVKASCLREWREKPWWVLHWARAALNVNQAIFYMERILDEAINN